MKRRGKYLFLVSMVLSVVFFFNSYYCSAQTLNSNIIPVTGKIYFRANNIQNDTNNQDNSIIDTNNKEDIHGNFEITKPLNPELPKTGYEGNVILIIVVIIALLLLILQYKKSDKFENVFLLNLLILHLYLALLVYTNYDIFHYLNI